MFTERRMYGVSRKGGGKAEYNILEGPFEIGVRKHWNLNNSRPGLVRLLHTTTLS